MILLWSLVVHFFCEEVRSKIPAFDEACRDAPAGGSSAGRAAAALVNAFKITNANMGERSKVPPSGGMIPRNMFK